MRIGISLLKRRTQQELMWSAFAGMEVGMDYDDVLNLRVGSTHGSGSRVTKNEVNTLFEQYDDLSVDERDDIYVRACAAAGLSITKEQLVEYRKKSAETKKEPDKEEKKTPHGMRHTVNERDTDNTRPVKSRAGRGPRLRRTRK